MRLPKVPKILAIMVVAVVAVAVMNVAYASNKPQLIQAIPGTLIYTPSAPNFNPYAPSNQVGNVDWPPT